jgi:vacuolar-type H+-ATPase subunit I/STV1
MAKWFRSEPMEYISLIMNEDAAHDCLADLGKLGVIQFTDVSHALVYRCGQKQLRQLLASSRDFIAYFTLFVFFSHVISVILFPCN